MTAEGWKAHYLPTTRIIESWLDNAKGGRTSCGRPAGSDPGLAGPGAIAEMRLQTSGGGLEGSQLGGFESRTVRGQWEVGELAAP